MILLARSGAPEGLWLRAERQTGGRGRQGREWQSPPGNLYASTLVRLRPGDPPAATLALVAAVALHELGTHFLRHSRESGSRSRPQVNPDSSEKGRKRDPRSRGGDELRIKWPNDLLLGGAKLAGILAEREGDAVVVGFGVNIAQAPQDLDRPVADLAGAADPGTFLDVLADSFARWLGRWRGQGLAPIRAAWLAAAHPRGTALSTDQGEGLFDGLDETGALRLRLADGAVRVIHAGDVFLI